VVMAGFSGGARLRGVAAATGLAVVAAAADRLDRHLVDLPFDVPVGILESPVGIALPHLLSRS
jgi:hypothetical protein